MASSSSAIATTPSSSVIHYSKTDFKNVRFGEETVKKISEEKKAFYRPMLYNNVPFRYETPELFVDTVPERKTDANGKSYYSLVLPICCPTAEKNEQFVKFLKSVTATVTAECKKHIGTWFDEDIFVNALLRKPATETQFNTNGVIKCKFNTTKTKFYDDRKHRLNEPIKNIVALKTYVKLICEIPGIYVYQNELCDIPVSILEVRIRSTNHLPSYIEDTYSFTNNSDGEDNEDDYVGTELPPEFRKKKVEVKTEVKEVKEVKAPEEKKEIKHSDHQSKEHKTREHKKEAKDVKSPGFNDSSIHARGMNSTDNKEVKVEKKDEKKAERKEEKKIEVKENKQEVKEAKHEIKEEEKKKVFHESKESKENRERHFNQVNKIVDVNEDEDNDIGDLSDDGEFDNEKSDEKSEENSEEKSEKKKTEEEKDDTNTEVTITELND